MRPPFSQTHKKLNEERKKFEQPQITQPKSKNLHVEIRYAQIRFINLP